MAGGKDAVGERSQQGCIVGLYRQVRKSLWASGGGTSLPNIWKMQFQWESHTLHSELFELMSALS